MTQSKNNAIQGIRFWAIALIIASHCGFLAQGGLGNCIFFAMSGFFVCQPFSDSDYEYNYFSIKTFLIYYFKRIIRIIPVAWLCMIFAAWGLRVLDFRDFTTENSLVLNMFFIRSKGHLWFLQQEIFFYVCAPFMLLVIGIVKKLLSTVIKKKLLNLAIFVILTACVFISYKYIPLSGFLLKGNGGAQVPMLWLFLIGMSFAYLQKILKIAIKSSKIAANLFNVVGAMFVITCLILTILTSEQILAGFDSRYIGYYVGWEHQLVCAYFAAAVLVVLCLLPANSLVKTFLGNRVFTLLGNASFSMYLIHGFLLPYFAELSVYSQMLVIGTISLCMALVIYKYIESPLMEKTRILLKK